MVQRLPTLLLLASTPASADWAKGGFATLTFDTSDPGAVTYSFAYASSTGGAPIALPSNALATVGPAATSSGTDALGAYEALTLPVAGGALAVAYYAADDAFVWTRAPRAARRRRRRRRRAAVSGAAVVLERARPCANRPPVRDVPTKL